MAITLAFIFQYVVGPFIMNLKISNYVTKSWIEGCSNYYSENAQKECVGNQGVYRVTFISSFFFILSAVATCYKPSANREAWPAKYTLFVFGTLATCLIPNDPIISKIYFNIARVFGAIFVIFQELIILDLVKNWNESWVEKSNKAETEKGQMRWLGAILASCIFFLVSSITSIELLFQLHGGCTTNITLILITLVLSVALTLLQLMGEEGNLLSSSVICSYGIYLCFISISKNPDESCNSSVKNRNILGIVFGVSIALLSLAWIAYSYTAEELINGDDDNELEEILVTGEILREKVEEKGKDRNVHGIVTSDYNTFSGRKQKITSQENSGNEQNKSNPLLWKINILLAMASCWIAMTLTEWGSIQVDGSFSNPDVSRFSMWIIIASQWVMFFLYGWLLLAPTLFPDRDFS